MTSLETNKALHKKTTILIVDDQPVNIQALSGILQEEYTIMVATGGAKALEIAWGEKKPDLILLDVLMPEMDGYEVLRRLKADENTRDIPVIFVTVKGAEGDEEFGLELGAADYISKPYIPGVVKARVQQLLERMQAEEKLKAANQELNAQNQQIKANNQQLIDSEKNIQSTKRLMEGTLNAIPDIIGVQDNDHHIIMYNQAGYDLLNMTQEEVSGKKCYELIGKTKPCKICATSKCYSSKKPEQVERYEESLGAWLDVRAYPILDKNGKVEMVIEHLRDVTERKQTEEAIATERERLAVTLRSIGDGVITTDTSGNIVLMNKVAEELTGWQQDEAEGKPLASVFNIINENTRKPHENPVGKVLSTGQRIELENDTLLICRDGTERVIADSGSPINNKESMTIGVVLVFRDMTEKQRLNDAMQRAQKLESLGVLAGGIAHDFNNIMGGIFGYIELAKENSTDNGVKSYLSEAMNAIDRARALTGQLLTFAKGGDPIQKVQKLFPFVEETTKFALSGTKVSCDVDVSQDLWACNFDKNQIGQVIDNLVINAQQAMAVGGTIELTARNITLAEKEHPTLKKDNYVKISVKDHGIGIRKEHVSKIFDPFFSTKTKGHGLGLATCYSIINRHGGSLEVESEPGKGTAFHIYLPAATDPALSPTPRSVSMHKGSGTILVMDDEELLRDIAEKMLTSFGYSVICRENGKDAVEFFASDIKAKREIVGMIFDLTVPGGMGGKEAIAEIRKLNSDIPVFVASGYAEDPIMKNPSEYGFTASICKPFRQSELSEMLNNYMQPEK